MQKEILTLADCKARLLKENEVSAKEERLATLFWIGFTLVVSLIWGLLLCLPLKLISGEIPIYVYWLLGVLCAIPPVVLLHIWFVQRPKEKKQYLYSVKNGIEIVEDTLKRAYEDGRPRGRSYQLFYVLEFEKHGKVEVSERQYYAWSKLYSMSYRGIYNTSVVGDTFYIVRLKGDADPSVLEFYNTKLFELCPDGTEKKSRSSWRDSINVE